MTDALYRRLVKRWEEVTDLPTQTVGPFTPLYKQITRRLKVMPWPWLAATAVCAVIGAFFLVGSAVTFLVTILQRGF
jgi:hypothetical protein